MANVYWIGGAPDAGKSTVAELLCARYGLMAYHYDGAEQSHLSRLPCRSAYRTLMDASFDGRWLDAEPKELCELALASFRERWPLVLEDLRGFGTRQVVAEGFGLMPEIVGAVAAPERAVFLVASEEFKSNSVARRDKPEGRHQTRDPDRARRNMLDRDTLIAEEVRVQADKLAMLVVEARLGRSAEGLANLVATWFRLTAEASASAALRAELSPETADDSVLWVGNDSFADSSEPASPCI